jgi:hypothetical protein
MRVQHTINISSKMPRSFNNQNQQEAKMLAYVGVSEGVSEGVTAHVHKSPDVWLRGLAHSTCSKIVCSWRSIAMQLM